MILQLLNVLIGLALVYLIFSTIASALFEIAEGRLRRRGRLLARGIEQLLARTETTPTESGGAVGAAVKAFYQHPLINSLYEGGYVREGKQLPSYIPPERFAQAVLMLAEDAAGKADDRFVQLRALADRLAAATTEAGKPSPTPVQALVTYFDQSMDRVSGWFARYARGVLLAIGCGLALCGNVDTLRLVRVLAMDPVLADRIAETAGDLVAERSGDTATGADDCTPSQPQTDTAPATGSAAGNLTAGSVDQQLCQLRKHRALAESLGLPIGWNRGDYDASLGQGICSPAFWRKLFGLALTGLALSFGATFWFDLLNQLVSLRASLKPADKKKTTETANAAGANAGKAATSTDAKQTE